MVLAQSMTDSGRNKIGILVVGLPVETTERLRAATDTETAEGGLGFPSADFSVTAVASEEDVRGVTARREERAVAVVVSAVPQAGGPPWRDLAREHGTQFIWCGALDAIPGIPGESQLRLPADAPTESVCDAVRVMAAKWTAARGNAQPGGEASAAQLLLETSDQAVLVVAPETGEIVSSNSRFGRMFGAEFSTLGQLAGAGPEQEACLLETLASARSGLTSQLRWQTQRADGALFWVEVNATPFRSGAKDYVALWLRDVTETVIAERELVRIREALDDCGAGVLMLDTNLRANYLNAAFGELFGYTRDQTGEVDVLRLFVDPDRADKVCETVLAGGCVEEELEMATGKRRFPVLLRATPVLNSEFEITGVMFILNDITERKEMETQLLQSQNLRSIGQLAAGIAHEMNTPLQYVGDNTRFLKESFEDVLGVVRLQQAFLAECRETAPGLERIAELEAACAECDLEFLAEDVPSAIEQSLEGLERVTQIVRALRQFTHPGSDDKKMLDLNAAIESTATVARNEWRYVAELETDFDPELPPVPCVPGELNQVILNLVVNAAHAIADVVGDGANAKGRIRISTRRRGSTAEVRVADTGCGIPPEVQASVFDPFFTTKEVGRGTGQGLAISRAVIVEKHGGTLTFETEPRKGTTFVVRLPLATPEECV